jgi:N-ethylmaleimide reductase
VEVRCQNLGDLIAFGRLCIASSDTVGRLRTGVRLNVPTPATFFGGGMNGYNDYPALTSAERGAA